MEHIISALIGFAGGVCGSIVAPWIHWGIEKRRDKRAARRALINIARQHLNSKSFNPIHLAKESCFIQLKPYLEKQTVEWVERYDYYYEAVDNSSTLSEDVRIGMLEQLHLIEKRWGLI